MFLSKRWLFVWTMLPRLVYQETNNSNVESKSVWWFLDRSMQFHDAPLLECLFIELGPLCPVDVDVVKWVAKAVDRRVRWLVFKLCWNSEPTRMPTSLYTCKTLVVLTLSRKIIVDVPSPVSLPSLKHLNLLYVVYKDEDSHVRLLSGCPVLNRLQVFRSHDVNDNVRKFSVKVPSLLRLTYVLFCKEDEDDTEDDTDGSLVIDTPALVYLDIFDNVGISYSIEYMPRLDKTFIDADVDPDGNFLRSLSRIKYLLLALNNTDAPWYNAVRYSRLMECITELYDLDLCETLVVLLSNCPKQKVLRVNCEYENDHEVPLLWNQPSSVPKCLSSHLEIFEWEGYAGREDEKELVRYILENSKCLKTAGISPNSTCSAEDKQRIIKEIESMHKVSTYVLPFSARFLTFVR